MPESKRLIVFVTTKSDKIKANFVGVDFYALPEEAFTAVENVRERDQYISTKFTDHPPPISQPLFSLNHCHLRQSYASLRGCVYCVGGHCFDCDACFHLGKFCPVDKTVYCWDSIHNDWKSLPDTNHARRICCLQVFKGQLYVTGYHTKYKEVLIERLDEAKGSWAVLPCPPPHVKLDLRCYVSAAVESKGFFLFGSPSCEYFYSYTPPNTWELMNHLRYDPDKLFHVPLYSLIVTENYLLWLSSQRGSTIVGFDHNDGNYFEINLVSEGIFPAHEYVMHFPWLVFVENHILALVWRDDVCIKGPDGSLSCVYHCTKFTIDLVSGHPRVKIVSHQSCAGPESGQKTLVNGVFCLDLNVSAGNPSTSTGRGQSAIGA